MTSDEEKYDRVDSREACCYCSLNINSSIPQSMFEQNHVTQKECEHKAAKLN